MCVVAAESGGQLHKLQPLHGRRGGGSETSGGHTGRRHRPATTRWSSHKKASRLRGMEPVAVVAARAHQLHPPSSRPGGSGGAGGDGRKEMNAAGVRPTRAAKARVARSSPHPPIQRVVAAHARGRRIGAPEIIPQGSMRDAGWPATPRAPRACGPPRDADVRPTADCRRGCAGGRGRTLALTFAGWRALLLEETRPARALSTGPTTALVVPPPLVAATTKGWAGRRATTTAPADPASGASVAVATASRASSSFNPAAVAHGPPPPWSLRRAPLTRRRSARKPPRSALTRPPPEHSHSSRTPPLRLRLHW